MRYNFLALLMIVVVGCSSSSDLPPSVGLSYLSGSPLRLNVARIEVVKEYKSTGAAPFIEHQFPVPPSSMIQQWVQDRLLAVGKTGHAVVTIEDASVIEVPLKRTTGLTGLFTVDQSERYDAKLAIKIEIFDGDGKVSGFAQARAKGSRTVSENMTLGQRRRLWIDLMEKMMNNLDEELEKSIHAHLKAWVS